MSTTVRVRAARELGTESFADITPSLWAMLPDDEYDYVQLLFIEDLAPVQIEAVKMRAESTNGNHEELLRRARAALAANRTYLLNPAPTQAEALAQVASLTRQVNALIRFALRAFDGTE